MEIANLVVEGEKIREIINILDNYQQFETQQSGSYNYTSEDITVLMREAYYMRINSTLMSVIILKFLSDSKVEIELVTSGGKEGSFMISYGAEKSQVRSVVQEIMDVCTEKSWKITKIKPQEIMESLTKTTIDKLKNKILDTFKK